MVTSGKQLHVQLRTTCSGLTVAELLLLLQDPGLGRVRVTSASGASCSAVRWHLATRGCVDPKAILSSRKFGRPVCGKVDSSPNWSGWDGSGSHRVWGAQRKEKVHGSFFCALFSKTAYGSGYLYPRDMIWNLKKHWESPFVSSLALLKLVVLFFSLQLLLLTSHCH